MPTTRGARKRIFAPNSIDKPEDDPSKPTKESKPSTSNCPNPETPTFTCFPQLPPELRFKIWNLALDDGTPRLVSVFHKKKRNKGPSPLLRVSRESRCEAAVRYERFQALDESSVWVTFDHRLDTLYLEPRDWMLTVKHDWPSAADEETAKMTSLDQLTARVERIVIYTPTLGTFTFGGHDGNGNLRFGYSSLLSSLEWAVCN